MNPLDYLQDRGYMQDVTNAELLRRSFEEGVVTAYVGFDPTARSLHVGHMLGIMVLGTLQRFGHRPIPLGGGGTVMVGDPTGRTSARPVMTLEEIRENLANILTQFDRFIDFDGGRFGGNPPALLLNNADWLLQLRYIEFLRDIGRHFSVNEMLAVESYKQRIETTGLNFVEFNYRIVQAYDFLHLFRTEGCLMQMGGSDQWGNITAGVDLIRRVTGGEAVGLVWPLLTTATGEKMGKSAGNSVWLDATMTTPYDFYQYWINVDDADVEKLLRFYTFLTKEEIADLTAVSGAALRSAKRRLAIEVTTILHGEEAAQEADSAAQALFSGKRDLDDPTIPTTVVPLSQFPEGITVADAFIRAGLCSSRGDARRLAQQGGLSINDEKIEDVDQSLDAKPGSILLRVGKKRFMRLTFEA
ncbi:MAG: tyrosine--tRNA ligase [Thermomicrobiales bacterium]|nr:tyrosine--tRNA ligase [Thermomicrobiales bacterium]